MTVTLDDKFHGLSGFIDMTYTNNSPDTLTYIWFHLWPNAYESNRTAMARQLTDQGNTWFRFARRDDRGYIDSLSFLVNNQPARLLSDTQYTDIAKLVLNEPLLPGRSANISTPFYVQIPSGKISRLGHLKNDYYITQWYPKPAVYDVNGWHPMPYLTQGEFYSEYGDYEVAITVPKDYVVAATGELQNGDEKNWLIERAAWSRKIVDAFTKKIKWEFDTTGITKTLVYKASDVHDFAWFADREALVGYKAVQLPSGRNVDTWSFYKLQNAYSWYEANDYIERALLFYSRKVGEYRWPSCSAFDGNKAAGGDMEYPMLTLIAKAGGPYGLESVIVHEVGHNWFYGMLGSNERDNAWMDEGINSFYERLYFDAHYADEKIWTSPEFLGINELPERLAGYYDYLYEARVNLDQPADLTSEAYTEENYAAIVYSKTTEIMYYLRAYMGPANFDRAMQEYFTEWKFRHPQPDDLEAILRKYSPGNIDFVFDDLLGSTRKIDYEIQEAATNSEGLVLVVLNKGGIDAPFPVKVKFGGQIDTVVWVEGFTGTKEMLIPMNFRKLQQVRIDDEQVMTEVNRKNNFMWAHGLFRKQEKLRLQFFTSIENPYRTQLYFFPTVGWNDYNKVMAGISLYNKSLYPQKFEFVLNPMYASNTHSFVGNADVSYNHFPRGGKLYRVGVNLPFSRFAFRADSINLHYVRVAPGVQLEFKKQKPTGKFRHALSFRSYIIVQQLPPGYMLNRGDFTRMTNRLEYSVRRDHALLPFYLKATFEHITEFGMDYTLTPIHPGDRFKLYLEAGTKIVYHRRNKGLSIRLFAGTFLDRNNSVGDYRFRMSGYTGYQDYTFSDYFFGRSEATGFFSQQMAHGDGDFKVLTYIGQTREWLVALNFKADIPVIPVSFYFDIGTYAHAWDAFPGSQAVVFNGGICVDIWPGIAEVYFPLFMSSDIKNSVDLNTSTYWEQIRFVINLKKLDPFEHARAYFR